MIPEIANATSAESVVQKFDESDPIQMRMLKLLKQRYAGTEHPFLVFPNRDGYSYLVIPKTVRAQLPELGAKPSTPALRLSELGAK